MRRQSRRRGTTKRTTRSPVYAGACGGTKKQNPSLIRKNLQPRTRGKKEKKKKPGAKFAAVLFDRECTDPAASMAAANGVRGAAAAGDRGRGLEQGRRRLRFRRGERKRDLSPTAAPTARVRVAIYPQRSPRRSLPVHRSRCHRVPPGYDLLVDDGTFFRPTSQRDSLTEVGGPRGCWPSGLVLFFPTMTWVSEL